MTGSPTGSFRLIRDDEQMYKARCISQLEEGIMRRHRWSVLPVLVPAIARVKELHPADMLLAFVRSSVGDEHPSIATARRQLHNATGYMPEESSFYERITPGLGDLGWELFLRALSKATRVQRQLVAKA